MNDAILKACTLELCDALNQCFSGTNTWNAEVCDGSGWIRIRFHPMHLNSVVLRPQISEEQLKLYLLDFQQVGVISGDLREPSVFRIVSARINYQLHFELVLFLESKRLQYEEIIERARQIVMQSLTARKVSQLRQQCQSTREKLDEHSFPAHLRNAWLMFLATLECLCDADVTAAEYEKSIDGILTKFLMTGRNRKKMRSHFNQAAKMTLELRSDKAAFQSTFFPDLSTMRCATGLI